MAEVPQTVSAQVEPDMVAAIRLAAAEEQRNVSNVVRIWLRASAPAQPYLERVRASESTDAEAGE